MFCCAMDNSPIDFYMHPISPPCRAVLMVAKELNLNLNHKWIDIMTGGTRTEEFAKINFMRKVPTIVDGDLTIWESRAIMKYFVNQYSPGCSLYPKDPKKRAMIDMLLYADIGSIYRYVYDTVVPQVVSRSEADAATRDKLKEGLNNLETFLDNGDNHFLTGDNVTLADLSIYAGVTFLEIIDYDLTPFPNIRVWIGKLQKQLPYDDEITRKPHDEFKVMLQA